MHVEIVRDWERLTSLAEGWDLLAGSLPFRGAAWLHAWWRHYGTDHPRRRLLTGAVWSSQGELVGLAPLYLESSPLRGRIVKFLGDDEVCTDYLGVLARGEQTREVAAALADALVALARGGDRAGAWDLLELDTASPGEPGTEALWDALSARGLSAQTLPGRNNWRLTFPPTWDEYMEVLSRDWRKKFRKLKRKWIDSGVAVRRTAALDTLDQAWRILADLHQKRRRSLGEAGRFLSPRVANFHREVIERLYPKGQVRIHWIEVQGRPIAVEYALLDQGVHYAYQSGIDPEYLDYDPGTTLFVAYVLDAMALGESAYDCMRGDEPYKAHWRAVPTPTQVFRVIAPGAASHARHRAWEWGRRAKQWIRRGLAAAGMRRNDA